MSMMYFFRQKPVVVCDFNDFITDGDTYETGNIPCVGWTTLYGRIWADEGISLIIEQGTMERPVTYRNPKAYFCGPGECIELEIPITGKFLRIKIQNEAGVVVNVESFFCLRGI